MASQESKLPTEEVARRGKEIYQTQIRPQVEPANKGKVVAIDVLTGDYALGENALAASDELFARKPKAEVWLVRVGHRTFRRIGRCPRGGRA